MANTYIKAGQFSGVVGNGTNGYFLISNGDGTMSWVSNIINPTITNVDYPGVATAADPAGGESITLTGTGFKTGATVTIGGTAAPSVSYVSATQLTITTPAKIAGEYDIVVTNTDTGSATYVNGISYNGVPAWTTAAGSLGTFPSGATISTITLQASEPDAGTITFNITNGALPTGLSLTGANIDGTTSLETADTLYTFIVTATDDESQATPRTFTITVLKEFISSENFTINTYTGTGGAQAIEGKIGTAADFKALQGYIVTPVGVYSNSFSGHSVSFWMKSGGTNYETPIWTRTSSAAAGWHIRTSTGGNGIYWDWQNSTGGAVFGADQTVTLTDGWHHVVAIWDGTTNANGAKLYIDGSLFDELTANATLASQSFTLGPTLGADRQSPGRSILGLDQVRIFNKALSSSEVTTIYGENSTSATKSTTDIFDDGSGVALYEFEKGAIDTGGTNGYIGSAGVFNGSSSRINLPSNPINGLSSVSFSFWIKPNDITSYQYVLSFINSVDGWNGVGVRISNTGKINIVRANNGTITTAENSTTTLSLNVWQHVAVTVQQSGTVIYLNGSEDGTFSNTPFTTNNTGSFDIGMNEYASGVTQAFTDASIDQVRIFNRVITTNEVTTLYGETSASATKSTTDIFNDSSGVALYELEGNANDTSGTYNGSSTNVSYAYDGTPTNVSFVGTSFQPDLVWFKERNGGNSHQLYDTVRGDDFALYSDQTSAQYNYSTHPNGDLSPSITSNGFTTPAVTNNGINRSGGTYAAWCWKAGGAAVSNTDGILTSQVSANQAAGFSIVKYTGNLGNATIGHGLDEAPELVIYKSINNSRNWIVQAEARTNTSNYLHLNLTDAYANYPNYFHTTTNETIGIQVGDPTANANEDYIAYCFHSVDGYQKVGSYTGNNSSGGQTITGLGFSPRFLLVKHTAASAAWRITDSARGDNIYLYPNLTNADDSSSGYISLITDGFRLNGLDSNASGTYIYLAIA